MPYIPKERRGKEPEKAGELSYEFAVAIVKYIRKKGKSYQALNDIIGALEACRFEMVRRLVNPYEDEKRSKNGDVLEDV